MNWSTILPLIYTAFGWILNELSQIVRLRREDRRAIGRALTDLLLIHRRFRAIQTLTDEIKKHKAMSSQETVYVQLIASAFLPDIESLQERYNEAVKSIAGIKPLLGFELNLQEPLSPTSQIKGLAATDEKSATVWTKIAPHIENLTNLERVITDLAWLHSLKTWIEIKRYLKQPLQLPEDYENLLKEHLNQSTD